MTKKVIVTFQLEGFHHWRDAPSHREYLRARHRHMFHFRMEALVKGEDREIEFHDFLESSRRLAYGALGKADVRGWSCEMIAIDILESCGLPAMSAVEVWEDGECGARVERN